jgi:hypothetical protein
MNFNFYAKDPVELFFHYLVFSGAILLCGYRNCLVGRLSVHGINLNGRETSFVFKSAAQDKPYFNRTWFELETRTYGYSGKTCLGIMQICRKRFL